jgi:hypothetical protein
MVVGLVLGVCGFPTNAIAQEQAQQPTAAERGLAAAFQQIGSSIQILVEELRREIATRDARIKELETRCGDACK